MNDPASQGAVTPAPDDRELLRRYTDEGSDSSFTELVRRHFDLVYGAALRRTGGDTHSAADVSQQVFTALAGEARKLSRHAVVAAWLHTATRNAALNLMISESRRRAREIAAVDLTIAVGDAIPDWERLRPLIDAAIDQLPEIDRSAVVLRFLEHRPFAEIGAAIRVSEDAARMRTERALEKLRTALARQGITSTAAALGALVSTQPVVAAPAGLAAACAAHSLAGVTAAAGFLGTLYTLMNTKLAATAVLSALVAFFIGNRMGSNSPPALTAASTPLSSASSAPADLVASLHRDNESLQAEVAQLKSALERVDAANTELMAQRSQPTASRPASSPTIGLPAYQLQREVLNNLKQIDAARKYYQTKNGHMAESVRDLVGVKGPIKTVRTIGGEDYSAIPMDPAQPMTVTTPDGVSVTFDPSGEKTTQIEVPPDVQRVQELSAKVLKPSTKALEGYRAAHNGAMPPNEDAVLPYFSSATDAADFVEFVKAKRAAGL